MEENVRVSDGFVDLFVMAAVEIDERRFAVDDADLGAMVDR